MSDWVYVAVLGLMISATLLIPIHRWLGLLTNTVFWVGIIAGYLSMESAGAPLGMGWSTLVFLLTMTGVAIHLFLWFMRGINQSESKS